MDRLLMFILSVSLSSCAYASIQTLKDGNSCNAKYISAFKSLSEVELHACGGSGSATMSDETITEAIAEYFQSKGGTK